MASISTTINLADRMSGPMTNIISSVDSLISAMESANKASGNMLDPKLMFQAHSGVDQAKAAVDELNASIQKADANTGKLSGSMKAVGGAGSFLKGLLGFGAVQKGIDMVTSSIGGAISRMDTMANYQKTMTAITGSSDAAAASVNKMSDALAKAPFTLDATAQAVQNFTTRGMSIGKATKQVLDWGDAVSFYGDGTNETFLNVTDALGKMMSKGKVEMDQLDRLTDAGINAVGIYAQATGRDTASVQEDLSKGNISAQDFINTVTNAFETGKNGVLNISGAMNNMEGTWSVAFTNMQAAVSRGWADILQAINDGMSNAGLGSMQSVIENIGYGIEDAFEGASKAIGVVFALLQPIFSVISGIGGMISSIGSAFVQHWQIILPILGGAVAAIGTFFALEKASAIFAAIKSGIETVILAIMEAQDGVLALINNKYAIMAGVVGVVIAVVIALAVAFSGAGHTAQTVFGAICGWINVVIRFFVNLGKTAVAIMAAIFGAIDACAQNMYIAFQNAIGKVKSHFYDLRATALSVVADIANSLNKLPFVKIDVSGLRSAASDFRAKAENAGTKKEYLSVAKYAKGRYQAYGGWGFKDGWVKGAYAQGAAFGDSKIKGLTGKIGGLDKNIAKATKAVKQQTSTANPSKGTKGTKAKKKDNKGSNDKTIKQAATDISLLRKLAEKKAMQRVVNTTVRLDMKGMKNYFQKDQDLDSFFTVMVDRITSGLNDGLNAGAEGAD